MRWGIALPVVVILSGCQELTGTFSEVIALQVEGAAARRVEEGATLQLSAMALDLAGTVIPADIQWEIVDTAAGITVDAATGLVTGVRPGGPWRVQARTGTLRANPVQVTVAGAPDSIAVVGDTALVAGATTASAPMTVKVFDLTSAPGTTPGLANVLVRYVVVAPAGTGIVLRASTVADSLATADSVAVATGASGQAAAVLRLTGPPPDSVVVHALVATATGGMVAGSPVRFVVMFQ